MYSGRYGEYANWYKGIKSWEKISANTKKPFIRTDKKTKKNIILNYKGYNSKIINSN